MDFDTQIKQFGEYGIVEKITYPIIRVSGLPKVCNKELVLFEEGSMGEIFALHEDYADVLMLSRELVRLGSRVARTGKYVSMNLCKEMLGSVIDPFGNFLQDYPSQTTNNEVREIDNVHSNLIERKLIQEPFLTGYSVVDSIVPLGKGQRELIIGDEKTGKTSFLLGVVRSYVKAGSLAVYAVIGGKRQEVALIYEFLKKEGLLHSTVVIFSACDIAPGSIYYTPYGAMTAAEYLSQFQDVVVIMDDLTTHAKYYREIALLAGKYPGRDSYPGDIFYAHSRLLERSGVIQGEDGKTRYITCLPVGHTADNDVTDYIISNLISITDGHLLFDRKEALKGRSPPIHIGLSVSRVGKQTLSFLLQDISRTALNFLVSKYDKAYTLSHFGEEMSAESQMALIKGGLLYDFFTQSTTTSVPQEIQALFIAMILCDFFNETHQNIRLMRDKCIERFTTEKSTKDIVFALMSHKDFETLSKDLRDRKEIFLDLCKP